MTLPKNILVPTDFSDNATQALDYAVALAAKLDAKVHVLHVLAFSTFGAEYAIGSLIEGLIADAQRQLDKLAAEHVAKAALAPTVLKTGDARDEIDRTAVEVEANLIVMGTHGRRGVSRLLLGSVAESIVRTAPCPVLLVRGVAP